MQQRVNCVALVREQTPSAWEGQALRLLAKHAEVVTAVSPIPSRLTIALRDLTADERRVLLEGPGARRLFGFVFESGSSCDPRFPCLYDYNSQRTLTARFVEFVAPDEMRVLHEGRFPALYSYAKSVERVQAGSVHFAARAVLDSVATPLQIMPVPRERRSRPYDHMRASAVSWIRSLDVIKRRLLVETDWNVGVVRSAPQAFLDAGGKPPVRWLDPPGNAYYADPFLVCGEIVCEHFVRSAGKGDIARISLRPSQGRTESRTVMAGASHLSYPYHFEYGGERYMVPEQAQTGRVDLFRASGERYEFVRTLLDVPGVDVTIFEHNATWWLACTRKDRQPDVQLYLYYARSPLEPWHPHRLNPVKTDIASARPAGMPFRFGGSLYRPAQDCWPGYGRRVVINRITHLDELDFREEAAAIVEPYAEYPEGIHHLAYEGDLCVIDGKRERLSLHRLRPGIRSLLLRRPAT